MDSDNKRMNSDQLTPSASGLESLIHSFDHKKTGNYSKGTFPI